MYIFLHVINSNTFNNIFLHICISIKIFINII